MPKTCRKWHFPETPNSPFHVQPQSFDPADEDLVLEAIVVGSANSSLDSRPSYDSLPTSDTLDDATFTAILQVIPKLTPNQLHDSEQQIQAVKRSNS
jgi:hypothetical protein